MAPNVTIFFSHAGRWPSLSVAKPLTMSLSATCSQAWTFLRCFSIAFAPPESATAMLLHGAKHHATVRPPSPGLIILVPTTTLVSRSKPPCSASSPNTLRRRSCKCSCLLRCKSSSANMTVRALGRGALVRVPSLTHSLVAKQLSCDALHMALSV